MDNSKSKHVTTSVPSIAIKFDATAEKIEELYASDEEAVNSSIQKSPSVSSTPNPGDSESSPLKYLPKLVKRSTSIDVSTSNLSSSPPSDPWRFFSDIKGKITKSVEEKITEIKSRNQEDGSPMHKAKNDAKVVKDNKENSSHSDSEDFSESSISKTCGFASTTEGVEMSSDEDTPSLAKDKKEDTKLSPSLGSGFRHRFRFMRSKAPPKEGTVNVSHLSKLYNINTEKVEQALPEHSEDVESGIEALEEANIKSDTIDSYALENVDVLKAVSQKFINIEIDNENLLNINEVTGEEIRKDFLKGDRSEAGVFFAPTGFVDLRPDLRNEAETRGHDYKSLLVAILSFVIYLILHWYCSFLAGLVAGIILSLGVYKVYQVLNPPVEVPKQNVSLSKSVFSTDKILEIPAVKEYQPLTKYEGWLNEYPDAYNPETYHISHTQSVYLRLQGNLLRISHSKTRVPKRAMWNETEIKASFSHHRIYNLLGAKISLLPEGLAKVRLWSKKYPLCITLNKEQMSFDSDILKIETEEDEKQSGEKDNKTVAKEKRGFFRKKDYPSLSQRFSKLTEGDEFVSDDSRASSPSPESSDVIGDISTQPQLDLTKEDAKDELDNWSFYSQSIDVSNTSETSHNSTQKNKKDNESPTDIKLYLFGRTDREKEDWFRRLTAATHKDSDKISHNSETDSKESIPEYLQEAFKTEEDYIKYMAVFNKSSRKPLKQDKPEKEQETQQMEETEGPKSDHILWLNAMMGRILFDCMRDPNFTFKVKERIQRKLCSIKLPYFIEELLITELSLGKTPPFIHKVGKPTLDERGLWVDMDVTYEGLVVLTLQTKLNLMKLKNPQDRQRASVRSAIYHSDVDDSAESSSDEEGPQVICLPQEGVAPAAASSPAAAVNPSGGKKFIKMVDKIAESKFFQAATENRYIKKAMEGVSNTDLRLTVEVRGVAGTVVLNIPAPPSDRLWVGFRPVPEIVISARPIVGERNISYIMVTSWIEKKLLQEFQKIMVIPNMEDFIVPVMNPKLPQ